MDASQLMTSAAQPAQPVEQAQQVTPAAIPTAPESAPVQPGVTPEVQPAGADPWRQQYEKFANYVAQQNPVILDEYRRIRKNLDTPPPPPPVQQPAPSYAPQYQQQAQQPQAKTLFDMAPDEATEFINRSVAGAIEKNLQGGVSTVVQTALAEREKQQAYQNEFQMAGYRIQQGLQAAGLSDASPEVREAIAETEALGFDVNRIGGPTQFAMSFFRSLENKMLRKQIQSGVQNSSLNAQAAAAQAAAAGQPFGSPGSPAQPVSEQDKLLAAMHNSQGNANARIFDND
jgi:hypothetical protein